MKLLSPAFNEGEKIPSKYTCDDQNINPRLRISDVPEGATKAEVEKAMKNHILAETKLMGRYERAKE